MTTHAVTRQQASAAIAQLVPRILQGVQLNFFVTRRTTQTQLLVLVAIHAAERCTMGQLATNLHVSMPTMTGVVTRLARAGYVRRTTSPDDRRQVVVELTAKGREFIQAFQAVIRHRWEEVLRALSPHELEAFYRVITKLQAQLQPTR